MKCTFDKDQFTRLLIDAPDDERRRELEEHLSECFECREEFESVQKMWDIMGEAPVAEPSAEMRVNFYNMLNTYENALEDKNMAGNHFLMKLRQLWTIQPRMQFAYSFVLVIVGVTFGLLLTRQTDGYKSEKQISDLSSQVEDMRQTMMLALLQNPSASERLRAVSYVDEKKGINRKMAEALLTTLNNDPNVNVRLTTLETLTNLAGDPYVREGLVQSIVQQESPLVQSALADVMVRLQEKKSIRQLKQLLNKKELNVTVKDKIQESIHQLI